MDVRSYIKQCFGKLSLLAIACFALCACDNAIYDYEGDCNAYYKVKFRYDYNMKFADAFANEVNSITLYLLDSIGNIVWQRTESGDTLATGNYEMTVDVAPGKYSLLAWGGTTDKGSFVIPETANGKELTCTLNREYAENDSAYVKTDIDRLFHAYLPDQVFPDKEGVYNYTLSLVKNTNNVRVVLQHLSGEEIDKDQFTYTITDNNGSMDWDNTLLPDETITYYAWHTDAGVAGIDYATRGAYSATIAELTIPRLVKGQSPRLTVTNSENGEIVFSLPFIDYALLVKGFYNRNMPDQEYLDRQDEYNMIFFLDEGFRWVDTHIYINSWKVVLHKTEL